MPPRRAGLVVAVVVLFSTSVATASSTRHQKPLRSIPTLKLLQFNVMSATHGRDQAVAAVIKQSGADVVTLEEVANERIFDKIAARTGLNSVWVKSPAPFSVGILSRYPIRSCTPYVDPPMQRPAYSCEVSSHSVNWWIVGAHLDPDSGTDAEQLRAKEAEFLLSQMGALSPARVVLAGDLNSRTAGGTAQAPLLVIPMIKAAGYIDSYRELYTAEESPGLTASPPPWGKWWRRPDYVFHSPNIRAVAAKVISTVSGYSWPSDHAALYVRLVTHA